MSDVTTLPTHGEVFLDARGGDRSMRLSWHHETGPDGVVVLSLWRSGLCVGSFRLRSREVPLLIDALARGLGGSWPVDAGPQQAPPSPPPQQAPPSPAPQAPSPPPPALAQQRPHPAPPAPGPVRPWPPVAPAAQAEPRRLHAADEQQEQGYGDVRPNPRRYLGGPPNSSGAESWSA